MSIKIDAYYIDADCKHKVAYEPVSKCPCCKVVLNPTHFSAIMYMDNGICYLSAFEYCPSCKNAFISKYLVTGYSSTSNTESYKIQAYNRNYMLADTLVSCEPNRFSKHVFDEKIIALSSQFDKIYNQALAAESSGLDEIAGLGYRKALEFLVKDFAIHEYPDESDQIKELFLGPCIKKYISNDIITTLAERCTWIGNDEAHYVRKQEDRDVSDMKNFIQAIVYFIGMTLIAEDAASMISKK